MSNVKIVSIEIKDFKKIKSQKISLSPITAIVGINTSGKSSLLQAMQLYTSIVQSSFKGVTHKGRSDFIRTLANEEVCYRPTENILDLRHGDKATQKKTIDFKIECLILDDSGPQPIKSMEVKISRGKNANLSLKYSGDINDLMPFVGNRENPFSIFAQGLSGIPMREEWKTRGALDAAAMHGDANMYLRTLLDHLFNKNLENEISKKWLSREIDFSDMDSSSSWYKFSKLLDECYSGAKVYVNHNPERDRFVDVSIFYKEKLFTLDMASMGMLQVIQILAYACFYEPPLLLLDEPDSHLHADSQYSLYKALSALSNATNINIVIATHSPKIISLVQQSEFNKVVWFNDGKEVEMAKQGYPEIPVLMQLGALNLFSEVFDSELKFLFLTEDKDTSFIEQIAVGKRLHKCSFISYEGCGGVSAARKLAKIIASMRPDVIVLIHRDRDFRTNEEIAFENELFINQKMYDDWPENIYEIFTQHNDIEHSFAMPEYIKKSLKDHISSEKLDESIDKVLVERRDEFTNSIRTARRVLKDSLYSERMNNDSKKELRERAKIPSSPPNEKLFLPESGSIRLTPSQCKGKSLYKWLLHELSIVSKISYQELTSLIKNSGEEIVWDDLDSIMLSSRG